LRKLNDFEKIVEIIDNKKNDDVLKLSIFHNQCKNEKEKHLWKNPIEIRPEIQKID